MTGFTVLLDANILYPAPVRDIFLQLATDDLVRAKWTADIHREWIDALLRNEPQRDRAALERTRGLMNRATRDCLVTGYERLIPALDLSDPDDRHVLAAAIVGRCDVIVTCNLRDFPEAAVASYGIAVQHPDNSCPTISTWCLAHSARPSARYERDWWRHPLPFKTILPLSPVRASSIPPTS